MKDKRRFVAILGVMFSQRVWIPISIAFSLGMSLGFFGGVAHSMFIEDLNQKRYLQIVWAVGGSVAGFLIGLVKYICLAARELNTPPRV